MNFNTHTQRHTGASGGFLHVDPSAQAWGEDGAAVPASLYWSSIAGCLVFVKGVGDFLFSRGRESKEPGQPSTVPVLHHRIHSITLANAALLRNAYSSR